MNLVILFRGFYGLRARVSGHKCATEERVIYDVTFASFAADHPFALLYVDKSEIRCEGLILSALHGFHDQRSESTIDAHNDPFCL